MAAYRKEKLEELIRRTVAETLLREIKDPRIGFVTVMSVKLSRDYSVADVSVSVLGDDTVRRKSMAGLESARGFIQHEVAMGVKLRITPRIRFHLDTSIEESVKMVGTLEDLVKKEDRGEDIEGDNGETRGAGREGE